MRNKICLLLFAFLILENCKDIQDKNTIVFSKYLATEFQIEIPDSLHYYILFPKMMCKGCSINTLSELDTLIENKNRKYFTFIAANEKSIPVEFKKINALQFKYDSYGKLDDLDMEIANITIVKTKSNKVLFIKPINIDEKMSLSELIKF